MAKTYCKLLGFSYLRYNRNFQSEEFRRVYWDREENIGGFPGGADGREPACQCRRHKRQIQSPGQEDPLEKGMGAHASIPAWRIPWTEEPGEPQFMGLQRVRHD